MIKFEIGKKGIWIIKVFDENTEIEQQALAITAHEAIELFGQITDNADKLSKMVEKEKDENNKNTRKNIK